MRKISLLLLVAALSVATSLRAADAPIYDQPAGKTQLAVVSYDAILYNWMFGYYSDNETAGAATIVEGDDGYVYINRLAPAADSWVKAERTADGKLIVRRQMVDYDDYWGDEYYICRMQKTEWTDEDGETYIDYKEMDNAADDYITFTYNDGRLEIDEEFQSDEDYPETVMGFVDYWNGKFYSWDGVYWNYRCEPLDVNYTELPEGVEAETMILAYGNTGDDREAREVSVAFDGNTVYFKTYNRVPGWFVGTIDGNKVVIEGGQYVGPDSYYGSHTWLHTIDLEAVSEDGYDYDDLTIRDNITLTYDPATRRMEAPADQGFSFDGAEDRIYYAEYYREPVFYVFKEVAAVPADPTIKNYYPYDDDYESAEFDYNVPNVDVDGNYINPDKLYYTIYVDNEVFEFEADEYEIDESLTEIPYTFDDYNINSDCAVFFFDPAFNVGIQSIYKGGGQVMKSNIVMYDIENNAVYTEPYNNVTVGIAKNNAVRTVSHEAYYDVVGREVNPAARGFVVKTVTFADGSQKNYKVVRK